MEMRERNEWGLLWWWRSLTTAALARRRKEREKGREKEKERMVWASLRLRMAKSSDWGGIPAARKREWRRPWSKGKRREEATRGGERRVEAAKGRRRRAGAVERWWKFWRNVKMDFRMILDGLVIVDEWW